jgi:hypothetical protein
MARAKWGDYRKIPADIRGAQWDGSVECATDMIREVLESGNAATLRYLCEPNTCKHDKPGENSHWLQLDSEGDRMKLLPGDWLVQGAEDGEFYRIPKGRFGQLYEPVPQCEAIASYPASRLDQPERCDQPAVPGHNVCVEHLYDDSDDIDAMRKENR